MKSRPNTGLRTIEFHRGNPESPGAKNHDEIGARKENENEKPFEENNFLKEDTKKIIL